MTFSQFCREWLLYIKLDKCVTKLLAFFCHMTPRGMIPWRDWLPLVSYSGETDSAQYDTLVSLIRRGIILKNLPKNMILAHYFKWIACFLWAKERMNYLL